MKLPQLIILQLTFLVVFKVNAQQKDVILQPTKSGTELIYDFSEVEPEFPGGEEALNQWIIENFNPPTSTSDEKVKKRAYVSFEVLKTGRIVNLKIVKGINEEVDRELLRMLKTMPNWTPGSVKDKIVIVRYYLPIDLTI